MVSSLQMWWRWPMYLHWLRLRKRSKNCTYKSKNTTYYDCTDESISENRKVHVCACQYHPFAFTDLLLLNAMERDLQHVPFTQYHSLDHLLRACSSCMGVFVRVHTVCVIHTHTRTRTHTHARTAHAHGLGGAPRPFNKGALTYS